MHSKMLMKSLSLALALSTGLALSACGTTPGDRAVSGGLLGAGAGAAIGSVTGSVGKGALIGGLGGALIGAVTSPDSLYLGDTPWRHYHRSAYRHRHHTYASKSNCTKAEQTATMCKRQRTAQSQ